MFRKLILAAAVATAPAAGLLAAPGTAAAQPPGGYGPHAPQHTRYVVLVRHCGAWTRYDSFYDYHDARRAVWHLERQGRDARIEVVHHHGW